MPDTPEPWMETAAELVTDHVKAGDLNTAKRILDAADAKIDREAKQERDK